MGEIKTKKRVSRSVKSANSPEPGNSTCGHGGCGKACSVRFVGPTSHVRDHHIMHAARGVTHIWTAAVVTGFALIVTGAIAFNTAQASTEQRTDSNQLKVKQDIGREVYRLGLRIDEMQASLKQLAQTCSDKVVDVTAEETVE